MKATENHFFFCFEFCRVSNLERDSLCFRGAGGRGRNLKPNMEGGEAHIREWGLPEREDGSNVSGFFVQFLTE